MHGELVKVYRISAITFKVRDMAKSCSFYSCLPGFKLVYGGANAQFTTFEITPEPRMSINLELSDTAGGGSESKTDFGRIIFHATDVDDLYRFIENDKTILELANLEGGPSDAPWGERFFHIRDPDGYQLSFAQPIISEAKKQASIKDDRD